MGDVVKFKRPSLKDKHKGKSLCKHGFHKWVIEKENQFEVKTGRLVTIKRCARCDETKTELT